MSESENEDDDIQVWKPIPIKEIKNKYEISNFGYIRHRKNKEVVKRSIRSGYLNFMYTVDGKLKSKKIHKLVAEVFVENDNEENTVINHINGDKFDNRAINLEWTTNSENVKHAIDKGLIKITKRAVIKCNLKTGKKIKEYDSILAASKEMNISDSSICNVCNGKSISAGGFSWKYAEENPNSQTDIDFSEYKQIDGFPNYLINNEGKIYSMPYKKFLKFQNNSEGSQCIQLTNGGKAKDFLVHRLVASYFLKKKKSTYNSIHHIDGDRTNNTLDNLEWCFVSGVEMLESKYDIPYYDPKTAIKPKKRKSIKSGPKDLLTSNPKNLSKKQREERKKLLNKNSGSKTSKKTNSIKKPTKKINNEEIVEV
jgi:hypothetical protein